MKNRTIIKLLLVFMIVSVSIGSCSLDEFLEKPPGVDITEDTIFSTKKDVETFLYGTYMWGLHSYYPYYTSNSSINPNPTMSMTACIADEGEMSGTFMNCQTWNIGAVERNNIKNQEDKRFDMRWTAIRRCNTIIERMQDCPALTLAECNQFTGEALFIRALNNFEMLKRYGGMPILKKRLNIDDDLRQPRATFADFVDFIVGDCDESARLLEDVRYTSAQRGRITDAAALALKARTLLYAASPLFNTATPYISGTAEQNSMVCYGNYKKERWDDAANAAKVALAAVSKHGFSFLTGSNPEEDYRKTWNTNDNVEIILAEKYLGRVGKWSLPYSLMASRFVTDNSSWDGATVCVPHNFVRKFEKMNGQPQTWNAPGVVGHDLMEKYAELDPRFRQIVAYEGSKWTSAVSEVQVHEGGTHNSTENITGAFMHKLLPTQWESWSYYTPNGMLFRVTEIYLNYAEALNESLSTPSDEVYSIINMIRSRAGMPNLPKGLTQAQMRDRIKNERDIELSFEDHRMWDIRRWMDAEKEGVMQGNFLGVKVNRISGSGLTAKCDYELFVFENRSFQRRMYMHPLFEHEVNKGYLIQNPGW